MPPDSIAKDGINTLTQGCIYVSHKSSRCETERELAALSTVTKSMPYKQDIEDEDLQEHGITAFYAGGPGYPYYQPVLECTCGFSSGRCDNWEEAGECMDSHLE